MNYENDNIEKPITELVEDFLDRNFLKEYKRKLEKNGINFYTHEEVMRELNKE